MNELEALSLAITREREAHRFYSEAAAKTTNAAGKKMLAWLATEEEGHLKILEQQWEGMNVGGSWLAEEGYCTYGDISHPIECTEFPSSSEARGEVDEGLPELEILAKAIEAEREATAYYADLARNTGDSNGRAMFEKLSRVEQGHLDLLEEEAQYLKHSKDMFTIHRFALPKA
jgi:rubrerythrin